MLKAKGERDMEQSEQPYSPLPEHPAFEVPHSVRTRHIFKLIVGYLVVLVLAGGIAGMYSWQHNKVTKLTKQAAQYQSTDALLQSQIKELQAAQVAANTKAPATLKLSDVQLNVPLSSAIADVTFQGTAQKDSGGYTVTFSSKSLIAAAASDKKATCAAADGPLGAATILPTAASSTDEVGTLLAQAGSWFVYFAHAQAPCSTTATAKALQTSQSLVLEQALLGVTSTQSREMPLSVQ